VCEESHAQCARASGFSCSASEFYLIPPSMKLERGLKLTQRASRKLVFFVPYRGKKLVGEK